jgi:hypothetical protein
MVAKRHKKSVGDYEYHLFEAIRSVEIAHNNVEELIGLDKNKKHGAVLRSIDLGLAKAIAELDYLDKEGKL